MRTRMEITGNTKGARLVRRWGSLFAIVLLTAGDSLGQCAMCRATLENNLSNGNIGIAAGINFGILYLFAAPYLFVALLAFLWYRTSKQNAR